MTYTKADLEKFSVVIKTAAELWCIRCYEYRAKHGDQGSCVLGAGIAVYYIPPRCRKPVSHIIISVPATAGQGSLTWEDSVQDVIDYLASNGIEAFYEPGHMD